MAGKEGGTSSLSAANPFRSLGGIGSRLSDSWLGRNWHTLLILVMIVFIALFVRSYFGYSTSVENGFLVSGGSDSYYHQRVIDHVASTGTHLVQDPLLNYPWGMRNARPPLYDWSIAVIGMFFSSITGVATATAVGFSLVFSTAIWGALTVVPVYLTTRAAFGNKAGIVAAFLFAIMPGHISRSVLSFADHDSMVLFFGAWSFYFLLMALMNVKGDRWVSEWKKGGAIRSGLSSYFRTNQRSIMYAALSGLSLAAVAMIWTGFAYLLIIVLAYFLVQVIVNRFRNTDSLGVLITVGVMLAVAFLIAAPVYYQMDYWGVWFDIPIYLFIAAMAFGLIFSATRDYPWTLVMPSFIILVAVGLLVLSILLPNVFEAIVTGQGYFVKSKLYSTISEAQAPNFSDLALSFGAVTFWLSFAGIVLAAIRVPKNMTPYLIFIIVWAAIAMFMALSAARFMFNASPAFAIAGGWMVALIIEKIKFSDISRVLSGGAKGGPIGILRRAIKVRHIAGALFLAFLVVLPNAWAAMDAAIPTELKRQYDKQVYDIMPDFAKPADYDAVNGSNWYFGAFTYSLPLPTNYWPAAWSWFRTADSDVVPVISRPAFLSWWDYGFEAIQESQHPTVADNFQNAYQFAGSFIMSQSETDAVALFIVRIVEETRANDDSIRQELINHGVDYTKLRDILDHPDRYVEVVKNNPQTYGPFDSELSAQNAKYQAARVELSKIGLESLVGLYHDLRELTGFDIGYFAIDSRLFPFTALGYNIFYAPAKLSDRRIDPVSNAPIDFFEIKAVDANGNMHDLANVTPEITIVDYRIVYKDMFYNSMLYRAFLGYGPKDVGMTSQGLPGLAGSLLNYPSAQAWNMTHFRMVYRTAYYNPFPQDQVQNRSDAWRAIGYDEALELRKKIESGEAQGTVDASTVALTRGVVFIQYYDGAIVEGTVTTDGGRPYPDLWVTVLDEYGIPHQTVKTDQDGRYSVIAPFGKVEIVFSYGKLDLRTQTATEVGRTTLYVTYAQAMREKTDENQDGIWDYLISKDVMIEGSAIRGMVYWDVDMNGEFSADVDQPMEGATVVVENTSQGLRFEATMDQDGYEFVGLPAFDATLYAISDGHSFGARTVALRPLGNVTHNIVVRPASVNGIIVSASGDPASGLGVALTDLTSGRIRTDTTDANGVFSFDLLLSGAYSLAALDSAITLGVQEFNLLEGEGLDKDLSLLSAFLISGRVMIGDLAANNVTIGFLSADLELWTRTDEKGLYSLLLPIGQYTVSCRAVVAGVEMISIDFVSSSGGTMSLDPSLKVGNVVRGTVTDASGPVANAEFLIKSRSSGAALKAVTNADGMFRTVLPTGSYFLFVEGLTSAYWDDFFVSSSTMMTISLSPGVTIRGQVWYDSDHDGTLDSGEGVEDLAVRLHDRDGRSVDLRTATTGEFSALVPSGKSYSLSVDLVGYASRTYNFTSVESSIVQNVELLPLNRTVSGSVLFGTAPMSGIVLTFKAVGGGAVTSSTVSSSGVFSLSLHPGQYEVVVDQNVTVSNATRYQHSSTLTVPIGSDPSSLLIELTKRARVYGTLYPSRTGSTEISFIGPEEREITVSRSFQLYLVEGNYSVYALNDQHTTDYVYFERHHITSSSSPLNLTTVAAQTLRGTLRFEAKSFLSVVPIQIVRSTGASMTVNSTAAGLFEASLPSGSYSVAVDHRTKAKVGIETRYVRFTGSGSITIPTVSQVNINLTRAYDNSSVTGIVLDRTLSPTACQIEFAAMSETAIYATVQATVAGYAISLAPGNYSVYGVQVGGQGVYLGTVEIAPTGNRSLDITLVQGLRFSGTTLREGVAGEALIEVSGDSELSRTSAPDGSFDILLPEGTYALKCSASGTEKGVVVSYRASLTIDLAADLSRAISLSKLPARSVELQWDSREKMALMPGETAVYNLRIVNTGNVPEVIEMSADAGNWEVEFSQERVSLDFGPVNSQWITVSVTPAVGSAVIHAPIMITATSTADATAQKSVYVDVDILPVYAVNLSFDKPYSTTGETYSYSLKVRNNGNIEDVYDIEIAGAEELLSLGWETALQREESGPMANLTLDVLPGKQKFFDIFLTPTRQNPEPNVQVIVVATSQNSADSYSIFILEPQLPKLVLPASGVSVTGDEVYYAVAGVPAETLVLVGVTIAVLSIFTLLSYQRGVFRRRRR